AQSAWPLLYLLVLRFGFGAFQAGIFPSLSRMMTDWMPVSERGFAQGWVWMSSRIGGAIAALIVVWTMEKLGGPHAFWYLAALGLLWSAAFWPWFRNRPAEMRNISRIELEKISKDRPENALGGHFHLPWRQASRSLSVWSLCAMYGC